MTTIVDGNYFHFLKIVAIRTIALYKKYGILPTFSTRKAKRCLFEENITLNVLKRSGGSRLRRWWSFQEGDESENQRWLKCLRSPPNAVSSKSRDLRPTST